MHFTVKGHFVIERGDTGVALSVTSEGSFPPETPCAVEFLIRIWNPNRDGGHMPCNPSTLRDS